MSRRLFSIFPGNVIALNSSEERIDVISKLAHARAANSIDIAASTRITAADAAVTETLMKEVTNK